MKITKIYYNWRPEGDNKDYGENYDFEMIGSNNCINIEEHPSQGEGDKWYYDVQFENGNMIRIFNPNQIFYECVHIKPGNKDPKQ